MLEFSLPTNDILLSKIFAILDSAKAMLNLQDFTISQTTLDQVFVNFASQENRETLETGSPGVRRQHDGQLPFLNDLKSRIGEISETRFHESANGRTNSDELMQRKPPSNLMKSSSVCQSSETGQLGHFIQPGQLNPNESVMGQLSNGHLLKESRKAPRKESRRESRNGKKNSPIKSGNQPTNFGHFGNQVALNNHLNLNGHLSTPGASTALYFGGPPQPITTTNYGNQVALNNLAYPLNYLNSSNLYCSIGRPSNAHLYNSVQQPLIVLPKARKK